ncbi:MAG: hypothetical protein Kow00121_26600 [Elainellaceae cyanobacterium]
MSIKAIVRTYIQNVRPYAQTELNWFRQQPSLESAIEKAAFAVNSQGKRHPHQRRLKKSTLEEAHQTLLSNIKEIQHCKSFDDLFTLVEMLLNPIVGAGELYTYDTALRIGAKLNLLPTAVYLHAGTRNGAKTLGFNSRTKMIEMAALPSELQQLEPYEVEDILCIFKDNFRQANTEPIENTGCYQPSPTGDASPCYQG